MGTAQQYVRRRADMVGRLRERGITDRRVLAAMAEVPRERFVPRELADEAYLDRPLRIGAGQTISAPGIVAYMIAALELAADSSVLEVGTGSGYAAAVLSRCCRSVLSVERHRQLARRAHTVLRELGYDNVAVRVGDGSEGAPDCAPFDAISVAAMARQTPPPALLAQLAAGGTLLCPVGRSHRGTLVRVRDGHVERLQAVAFVPLITGDQPNDPGEDRDPGQPSGP